MSKKSNHINSLLESVISKKSDDKREVTSANKSEIKPSNPAVRLAMGTSEKRAKATRQAVLELEHDQVVFFKYHDRHLSSLDSAKVIKIRQSIESEGQHFPGVVRKTNKILEDGRVVYELIVGRIRFESSRSVGHFKAFIKELNDTEAAKLMLSENEDRLDITPFERWLSVLPLVDDKVLSNNSIASLIGWDKGNFSKSLKARAVYEDLNLHEVLVDVSKVKLNQLIEIGNKYQEEPSKIKSAVSFIRANYPDTMNDDFLRAVDKRVAEIKTSLTKTLILDGSKINIKRNGDNLTLKFSGLPSESSISEVVATLKEMNSLK